MIDKLKNNLAKLYCLTIEEQRYMKSLGVENCEVLDSDGKWKKPLDNPKAWYSYRYRIKANFQPEPEYIDLEVKELDGGWLGVNGNKVNFPYKEMHLHTLMSRKNFKYFSNDIGVEIPIENIGKSIDLGIKVIARFVK